MGIREFFRPKQDKFLQLLIEQAGFTIRNLWGGTDRQPLGPRSFNMIFVAQKS